ncbi:GNAT family N-acetyltransferase [Paenibacillus sp. VTT E-133280]|uniref:GNAT family N-acetyltransferase n=1 Tax=Paenibacillus sp. VTT E-133280 TaxID=1986222 RepID=UPI000BA1853F|nr:GNAT family N-acetyltransferase [Paenibacillus sp. VTT E-133280]OZQ61069.1 GNAT family N-acetyltransferase [Paenibacillus sp. VTT E-133280]
MLVTTTTAAISDLSILSKIDSMVIGSENRKPKIEQYILNEQCVVASINREPVGYACYDTTFFECCFIQLVIVNPNFRRLGIAGALIRYIEEHSPTPKLFTSTNESNTIMQQVCLSLGFVRSGIIENLDDGDPEWVYFKQAR